MGQVIDNWNARPAPRLSLWATDIWPFNTLPSGSVPEASGWVFEPSGYVGKVEFRLVDDQPATTDEEFERQKEAFGKIPPIFLAPYRGQFVAACDGVIVDSDNDLGTLGHRFFEEHGDVPVYITKVGDTVMIRIPTPFLR